MPMINAEIMKIIDERDFSCLQVSPIWLELQLAQGNLYTISNHQQLGLHIKCNL